MINIGLIGAGAIGSFLLKHLKDDSAFQIVAVAELDRARAEKVLGENQLPVTLLMPLENFPNETEVFIEAASQKVAPVVAKFALNRGKTAVIASIGGLGDLDEYETLARQTGGKLILPSGAVAGLDALKAIPPDSIRLVKLTSTKPASALAGSEYLVAKGINPLEFKEPTMVFAGSARQAAEAFPKSANVAAAVAYATTGLDRVEVEMWAEPAGEQNRHTIRIQSGHGVIITEVSNVPFEENPRTSKLAAFSILTTVRELTKSIIVGT